MHTVYLGLGTNINDKKAYLEKALTLLNEKVQIQAVAPVYETKPWGFVLQDNFFNTVAKAETKLNPRQLLQFVKSVEKTIGRQERFINGPREIDIDILFFDNVVLQSESLSIPHAQLYKRDFVLQPLVDIAPDFMHPVLGKTVAKLLLELPENEKVVIKRTVDMSFTLLKNK